MKILEKIALILFSIIILVIAVTTCLVIFNWVDLGNIFQYLEEVIQNEKASRIILGASIVSIILAVKALFFPSRIKRKQEVKTGILLENKDGRLLISKDTIENLVNSVATSFKDAIEVQTKVNLDTDNTITVFISLLVSKNAIIKELSTEIQNKIKETIKRNTDLDVNQININIKNVENTQTNSIDNANLTKIKFNNVQINENQTKETQNETNTNKQEVI